MRKEEPEGCRPGGEAGDLSYREAAGVVNPPVMRRAAACLTLLLAAHPPATTVPSEPDQELLARFRPRFFKPPEDDDPLDFYADYVVHARLHGPGGRLLADRVIPEILNAHKDTLGVVLVHERPEGPVGTPLAYGRVDRERIRLGGEERALTFVTYNLAFRSSGLPAGLPRWLELVADVVASPSDWHQLDHDTAVTLALDEEERPFAAIFQVHNTLRTWILGAGIALPPDGRLKARSRGARTSSTPGLRRSGAGGRSACRTRRGCATS